MLSIRLGVIVLAGVVAAGLCAGAAQASEDGSGPPTAPPVIKLVVPPDPHLAKEPEVKVAEDPAKTRLRPMGGGNDAGAAAKAREAERSGKEPRDKERATDIEEHAP